MVRPPALPPRASDQVAWPAGVDVGARRRFSSRFARSRQPSPCPPSGRRASSSSATRAQRSAARVPASPRRQVRRDPHRPERVAAGRGRELRGRGPTLDHRQDHPPLERPSRQPALRRVDALEDRRLRFLELGPVDVGVEGRASPVVGRHVVPLPPPSGEAAATPGSPARSSPAAASRAPRSPARSCRASPRGAPGPGARPASPCRSPRGASGPPPARGPASPPCDDVLRPPDRRGGVHREDLADDEPVAEHAGSRPSAASRSAPTRVRPDVGGDVERRHGLEPEASGLAPPEKLPRRPRTPPAYARSGRVGRVKNGQRFTPARSPRPATHSGGPP